MAGLVDIHCHILAGIDDGPPVLAASVEMARAALASGVTTLAATPHLHARFPKVKVDELADRCQELRDTIASEGIELEVVSGGEVGLAWALDADDHALRLASYGQRGTDLLVETPDLVPPKIGALLHEVGRRGYRVALAHPERAQRFQDHPEELGELAWQGVLLQVDAEAVACPGSRSRRARLARWLLERGMIAAIASDAHRGFDWRPIGELRQAADALARSYGAETAVALTSARPAQIVAGMAVSMEFREEPPPNRWRRFVRL